MPSPDVVAQAESIITDRERPIPKETTPPWSDVPIPVKLLPSKKFHVTLAHQSVLKPFKNQLKAMDKAGQLPPSPVVELNPRWEERDDPTMQRRSYVAWVMNQDVVAAYLNSVMELVGGPTNVWETEMPPRRFHVSLANLTGEPGDSVR